MTANADQLLAAICEAADAGRALKITGSGSKADILPTVTGVSLNTLDHSGIIEYCPEELYISIRAGTRLQKLEDELSANKQILPFDPPQFHGVGTVGGAIACGLSGPARPWRGAVRDSVLGLEIVNGLGERLSFGGQVMKNVAGYDIARLSVGAHGRLGVILSATFKLLPAPEHEVTLVQDIEGVRVVGCERHWARRPLPITATAYLEGTHYVRLSGSSAAVNAGRKVIGGDEIDNDIWSSIRDHGHDFFGREQHSQSRMWCLWVPPATALPDEGEWLLEWSGGQRWWWTDRSRAAVGDYANSVGASAVCYDGNIDTVPEMSALEARIKAAFDPRGILNRREGEGVVR
ncbi:MAG: glycolate oxidase subunit GlcE [Woeseia sp.]